MDLLRRYSIESTKLRNKNRNIDLQTKLLR